MSRVFSSKAAQLWAERIAQFISHSASVPTSRHLVRQSIRESMKFVPSRLVVVEYKEPVLAFAHTPEKEILVEGEANLGANAYLRLMAWIPLGSSYRVQPQMW